MSLALKNEKFIKSALNFVASFFSILLKLQKMASTYDFYNEDEKEVEEETEISLFELETSTTENSWDASIQPQKTELMALLDKAIKNFIKPDLIISLGNFSAVF